MPVGKCDDCLQDTEMSDGMCKADIHCCSCCPDEHFEPKPPEYQTEGIGDF